MLQKVATIIDFVCVLNMLIYEEKKESSFRETTKQLREAKRKLKFRHLINFFSVWLETLQGKQVKKQVESDKNMKFFVFFVVTLVVINFHADAEEIECKFHE